MDTLAKFVLPGILFLLTVVFGFWLSKIGKPYTGILVNLHKLIALAGVVTLVLKLTKPALVLDTPSLLPILLVMGAVCVVALFASGALLSGNKLGQGPMLTTHRVATILLLVSAISVVLLLARVL